MMTLADQKVRKRSDQARRERMYLECFGRDTYGLEIPREIARGMERKGWIKWVPPKFGTTLYGITDAGRAALTAKREETR